MPQAGDTKWVRSAVLSSKATISTEAQVAENSLNWVAETTIFLLTTNYVPEPFRTLVGASGLVGTVYFATYETKLRDMLTIIKDLNDDEFYIAQRHLWHAGKRCWKPQNIFKVMIVNNSGTVVQEILID